MEQLTVRKLIEGLQQYDLDLKVEIEGCDCIGKAVEIEGVSRSGKKCLPNKAKIVLIVREYDLSGIPR